jgi:hypothetical protein
MYETRSPPLRESIPTSFIFPANHTSQAAGRELRDLNQGADEAGCLICEVQPMPEFLLDSHADLKFVLTNR